jgi:hypothetical protein
MGATVVFGDFEWDEEKAVANLRKHGVSFEEASAVFLNVNALVGTSDDYGEFEWKSWDEPSEAFCLLWPLNVAIETESFQHARQHASK